MVRQWLSWSVRIDLEHSSLPVTVRADTASYAVVHDELIFNGFRIPRARWEGAGLDVTIRARRRNRIKGTFAGTLPPVLEPSLTSTRPLVVDRGRFHLRLRRPRNARPREAGAEARLTP